MTEKSNLKDRPLLAAPLTEGIFLGTLFFAAALTPSLIPRSGALQGMLGGLAFAVGYGAAVLCNALWAALQLPLLSGHGLVVWRRGAIAASSVIALLALMLAKDFQNSIHAAMALPAVESVRPLTIIAIAAPVGAIVLFLGRLFRRSGYAFASRLAPLLPARLALLLGFFAAATLFWFIGNKVFVHTVLRTLDNSYAGLDRLISDGSHRPPGNHKTGGEGSLVHWDSLGSEGRNWISARPTKEDIDQAGATSTLEPLRVYVGLNSAQDVKARAKLALAELVRVGGFGRENLIIATPTGTGWMDPAGMMPAEYLLRGNVATVAVQYSYLPSWLSLLVQPEYGAETARAVFQEIYNYWKALPRASRPNLYLFGLSLGALNSDASADIFEIISDPFQGALWVGPPFATRNWQTFTRERNAGSPAWRPRFRDGSLVRFATQADTFGEAAAPWGVLRIAYLQYPSDPITFFEEASLFRQPDWMRAPRAPDVSPQLRWMPIVTFLQLLTDVMTATSAPVGYGHVYSAEHYLNGWIALMGKNGWTDEQLVHLRRIVTDPQNYAGNN